MSLAGAARRPFVACYGGTFDPVHLGHVGAALDVLERSGCDELRVIPAALPPHRGRPGATPAQRLRMLELAFAEARGAGAALCIDPIELQREGPSFSVDTLAALRALLGPEAALGWVLGSDALAGLERWHRWRDLVDAAHLLVLERPGHPLPVQGAVAELIAARRVETPAALRRPPAGRLWCVGQHPVEISATRVRERLGEIVAQGLGDGLLEGALDGLLSPSVWAYIRREGLYGLSRA
ncbi:MAG: nicotinate-nucleotide adenylyltransferase [Pseudomonadales bacterium]|nr:nicotinate-nucleotide adenylyltransferase [Pseudomonadales bacterium]